MERYFNRCSICFDSPLDFCLPICKDQFCRKCFQYYVSELVRYSWGIRMLQIKCPVCQDTLKFHAWSQFVGSETIQLYHTFNAPYKPIIRGCRDCGAMVHCANPPLLGTQERRDLSDAILRQIRDYIHSLNLTSPNLNKALKIQSEYEEWHALDLHHGGRANIRGLYHALIPRLLQLDVSDKSLLTSMSQQLIRLEHDPNAWQELQFWHIQQFPATKCQDCAAILCFSCGENGHEPQDCQSNMKSILEKDVDKSSPSYMTLEWKLRHSKPCPRCRILITRDDGCNKMECSYCGFIYCWQELLAVQSYGLVTYGSFCNRECLGTFASGKCGFYRCCLKTKAALADKEPESGIIFKVHVAITEFF